MRINLWVLIVRYLNGEVGSIFWNFYLLRLDIYYEFTFLNYFSYYERFCDMI